VVWGIFYIRDSSLHAAFGQTKSPSCTIQEGQTLGRDDKAFEKWDNKEGGINPLAGKSTRSVIPRGLTRYSLADRSYISREI
jgi:hypothetical protein